MNKEVKLNYTITKGCGNCSHFLDRNNGRAYCNVNRDAPNVNAMVWPKWRDTHEVHACGVCDNWSGENA